MMFGIDVSKHNGDIDWAKVAQSGVKFAIIRTGFGKEATKQIDPKFEANYKGCKDNGILVGAYHYSYAKTTEEARREAEFCSKIIENKQFEFPIYFDIEDETQQCLSKAACSEMVRAFCGVLESKGYWAGVYSFDSFFQTHLDSTIPKRYAAWVARVENVFPKYVDKPLIGIHQYSFKGKIDGISGDVDLDEAFKDYPEMIRSAGKNNLSKASKYTVTAIQSNLTLDKANDVSAYLQKLGMSVIIKGE